MEAHLRYRAQLNSSGVASNIRGTKKTYPKKVKASPKKEIVSHPKEEPIEESTPKPKPKPKAQPRINFIQRNIEEAAETKSRVAPPKPQPRLYGKKHQPGEIPQYLDARKDDLMSERETHPQRMQCPKGMRLMTEEERTDALAGLREEKADIESKLGHMPLRIESQTMIRNKRIMEKQLDEIIASIDQLSKKYVFIPE